jgi:hypothetical protein
MNSEQGYWFAWVLASIMRYAIGVIIGSSVLNRIGIENLG